MFPSQMQHYFALDAATASRCSSINPLFGSWLAVVVDLTREIIVHSYSSPWHSSIVKLFIHACLSRFFWAAYGVSTATLLVQQERASHAVVELNSF